MKHLSKILVLVISTAIFTLVACKKKPVVTVRTEAEKQEIALQSVPCYEKAISGAVDAIGLYYQIKPSANPQLPTPPVECVKVAGTPLITAGSTSMKLGVTHLKDAKLPAFKEIVFSMAAGKAAPESGKLVMLQCKNNGWNTQDQQVELSECAVVQ